MENQGTFQLNDQTLYPVPDIHGDYPLLKRILTEKIGCCREIDQTMDNLGLEWKSGCNNIMIVMMGDIVDGSRDSKNGQTPIETERDVDMFRTLLQLDKQAKHHNSRVIILIGNHELMNFERDFRYITKMGRSEEEKQKRINFFRRGSDWIKHLKVKNTSRLENCYAAVQINNYVLTHGGFCPSWTRLLKKCADTESTQTISLLNQLMYCYLLDLEPNLKQNTIDILQDQGFAHPFDFFIHSHKGPLFCRKLGWAKDDGEENQPSSDCESLHATMKTLTGKDGMGLMIAHTVQNKPNRICSEKLCRLDNALSRAFKIPNRKRYLYSFQATDGVLIGSKEPNITLEIDGYQVQNGGEVGDYSSLSVYLNYKSRYHIAKKMFEHL